MEQAFDPTPQESEKRHAVLVAVQNAISKDQRILLPLPGSLDDITSDTALQHVGIEENDFGGTIGEYRYQFEGEDDLLHIFIAHNSGEPVPPETAQRIIHWLFPTVPVGLMWFKPGTLTQHFYLGFDDIENGGLVVEPNPRL